MDSDDLLLQVALERSLIDLSLRDELLAEIRAASRGSAGQVLIRRGLVSGLVLSEMLAEVQWRSSVDPAFGRYRILRRLGAGGGGVVYAATDLRMEREVALKILRSSASPTASRRFLREVRAVGRLNHPNVVRVYDSGRQGSSHFLSMELVDGPTLRGRLAERKTERRVLLSLLEQAARGVEHAHGRGIVHRDLKPSNLLTNGEDVAKVSDFGLVRFDDPRSTPLTRPGTLIGTPHYIPPEAIEGPVDGVTRAADVYALGAMLYEILCGRPPYVARTAVEVLALILAGNPEPPLRIDPSIPPHLEELALACLRRDPARRPASAAVFAEGIRERKAAPSSRRHKGTESQDSASPAVRVPRRFPVGRWRAALLAAAITGIAVALFALRFEDEVEDVVSTSSGPVPGGPTGTTPSDPAPIEPAPEPAAAADPATPADLVWSVYGSLAEDDPDSAGALLWRWSRARMSALSRLALPAAFSRFAARLQNARRAMWSAIGRRDALAAIEPWTQLAATRPETRLLDLAGLPRIDYPYAAEREPAELFGDLLWRMEGRALAGTPGPVDPTADAFAGADSLHAAWIEEGGGAGSDPVTARALCRLALGEIDGAEGLIAGGAGVPRIRNWIRAARAAIARPPAARPANEAPAAELAAVRAAFGVPLRAAPVGPGLLSLALQIDLRDEAAVARAFSVSGEGPATGPDGLILERDDVEQALYLRGSWAPPLDLVLEIDRVQDVDDRSVLGFGIFSDPDRREGFACLLLGGGDDAGLAIGACGPGPGAPPPPSRANVPSLETTSGAAVFRTVARQGRLGAMLRIDGSWTRAWEGRAALSQGRIAIVWRDASVRAVRLVVRGTVRTASLEGE